METRNHELVKAGVSIPGILAKHRLLIPYKIFKAKLNWSQITGPQISKYSYIRDFYNHILVIGVLNPVWMSHLFMYKEKIIANINAYLHEEAVRDIRFVRSGRKPAPVVYQTIHGEETQDTPDIPIKQVIIPTDEVENIHRNTADLPEKLRDKVIQLRFAQKKRQIAYDASGFQKCPVCGRYIRKGEARCVLCNQKERQKKKQHIHDILQDMPWLTLEEMVQEGYVPSGEKLYEELYNEVRRDFIYSYIEKIHYGYDTQEDKLFLAIFITRKKPSDLTEDFIQNLTETYRSKEHVFAHRK